jgi:hypothetical protein
MLLFPLINKRKNKKKCTYKRKSKYKLEVPHGAEGGMQPPLSRDTKTGIFYNSDCSHSSIVVIADYMSMLGQVLRIDDYYPDFATREILSKLRSYVIFSKSSLKAFKGAFKRHKNRPPSTPPVARARRTGGSACRV